MNKSELVTSIAEKSGLTKADAERALSATIDSIKEAVGKGDTVTLIGFGAFKKRKTAPRTGRNPRTGETLQIKASVALVFRGSKKAIGA